MIIFVGVPGSGKSSQGRMLADKLGFPWLSTGEFLRMLVSGERRKQMVQGKLFDDQEMITLVQKIFHLIDTDDEFVLDGFPRTPAQVDWLLSQVKHGQLKVTAVVHLNISEEDVLSRLLKRGRQDDTVSAIKERFKEYDRGVRPALDHFRKMKIPVHDIDGSKNPEEVHKAILEAVEG